ncbi:hypothetical protein GCM10023212_29200 [Luteolibacter yonseiensis]
MRVTVSPDAQAVHLIGKEVHQVARVYPLFDVAKILLAEKSRVRAIFEAPAPHAPLLRGKLEESVFLTREEAIRHLWNSELRNELIEEETIEVDPPTGNFQAIARCGISGEWLGPVNFHSYQTNLRRLHRERFARMPFELYAAKVRTERGEEAVNAWLETMKKKTRWRIKGEGDDAWIDDRAAAERAVAERCFDKAYEETRLADVSGAIPAKNLSPSLLTSLKIAGTHARKHPAILIPAVCRAVEAEHLPVFKRQGKLHTGPARPHPLPANAVLAERPGIMVAWIRENGPAKLEGLWKAVLPEGSTAPPADYAADLFWLLHQGHILLYTDDTLVVQEAREAAPAPEAGGEGKKAKKKKKKKKAKVEGEAGAEAIATEATSDASTETEAFESSAETTVAEESISESDTAGTQQPVAQTEDSSTAAGESTAPATGTEEAPVTADTATTEEPATPAEDTSTPPEDITASEEGSAPSEEADGAVDKTATPTEETSAPVEEHEAADEEATAPEETAAASEEAPSSEPETSEKKPEQD